MDYEELYRLLPKQPKKWNQQEVLIWLKHIGYAQLARNFENESIDGSCLEILVEQDLIELGIQSSLQRKKLNQWINIGFKEYTSYLATKPVYNDLRMPLECLSNVQVSRHDYQSDFDEKTEFVIPDQQQFTPSRPTMNLSPVQKPQQNSQSIPYGTISEEELAKQIQGTRKQIFKSMPQNPVMEINRMIRSPQKQQYDLAESFNDLPRFGTPKFDRSLDIEEVQHAQQQQQLQPTTSQLSITIIRDQNGQKQSPINITDTSTIGRSDDCCVMLPHESVSRTHLWIVRNDQLFSIQDRGSLIGTYLLLEGQVSILKGFIISMGSNEFIVQNVDYQSNFCSFTLSSQMCSIKQQLSINQSVIIGNKTQPQLNNDGLMSQCHAKFTFTEEGLAVEDMNSENGTWLRLSKSGQQSPLLPISKNRIIKIADYVIMLTPLNP